MSHVETLLGDAREATRKRGHSLGRFSFKHSQARAECDSCGCAVLVTLVAPYSMVGAALGLGCKDGNAWLDAPPSPPAPQRGRARRSPKPASVNAGALVPA